jgi:hypothetical protein
MNPGAIEEGGKAINKTLDAFMGTPLVLALVLMNLALIGFVYYQGIAQDSLRKTNVAAYLEQVKETQQLLAKCVVPDK